jgi:hypothetical protein
MTKLTAEMKKVLSEALAKFNEATQELTAAIEQTGYELQGAPEGMQDMEDFSYDILTMVEEELEELADSVEVTEEHKEMAIA